MPVLFGRTLRPSVSQSRSIISTVFTVINRSSLVASVAKSFACMMLGL